MTEQDLPIPDSYVNFHSKYNFAYLDGLPYRILDDFIITDAYINPKGLEQLATCELQGTGRVVDPNDDDKPLEQRDGLKISFSVKEWSIEYEEPPSLWICSKSAWYKLMRPAPNYAPCYRKVLTRFKAITAIVHRLQEDEEACSAMTLDDWGDFCLDKTNGAADKSVLLEEADFFVQQMLFLGEDVFLNSTINKALMAHLGGSGGGGGDAKKPRNRTTAKRKAVENAEAAAVPQKRRRLTGAQKIEQQVMLMKKEQERDRKLREKLLAKEEEAKIRAAQKALREQRRQEKEREKQRRRFNKRKDDLEFVPTVDYRSAFTSLEHDFIPDLVMVWEFLNSFKAACNFKFPNFTVTELYKAVSYNYGHEIIPVKQTTAPIRRSARRGGKKTKQTQDEDVVLDEAKVIEDDREQFLMMLHHALITPLLAELEEKAILGEVVETVDEDHLIAALIEQVEELDEGATTTNGEGAANTDLNPVDADQAEGSEPSTASNNLTASNNGNVNPTDANSLKEVLPSIPLTSLEFNSVTWIEVIRLYLLKRSELFDNDDMVELLSLQEYFTLPLEAKLKILAFLCDEFMTSRAFRAVMDTNMARKTVLAIQLRDLKREVRALQYHYKRHLEANAKNSTAAAMKLEENEEEKREKLNLEKSEKNLQKEIASLSADLKDANRTLRLSPIGQDRMFDNYWMFPTQEHKNMLFVELTPEHEFESLRQNSAVDDQVIDMNIGEESLFSENTNTNGHNDEEKSEAEAVDNRPLLKRYLFTGKSSWSVCNKEAQLNHLNSTLDDKSHREKKLKEVLEPLQGAILTQERLDASNANSEEKLKFNGQTTALTRKNVMTCYYRDVPLTDFAGKKKQKNVAVNMKIVKNLREELLDLEDCIPFESIIIQTVDWEGWRNQVSTNNDPAILIDAITVLEQATNPKSFKSAWLKRERRLFKELVKNARTTAQLGILLELMRRNIKSTEDYTQSCSVCKNDDKDEVDNILLCDKCDKGFHLSCLSPPLTAVPSGFWFCNTCKDKLAESRKSKGQQEINSYFCAKCHDGGDLLCCDTCPRVYHTKCLDPPLTTVPEDDWYCPTCVEKRQEAANSAETAAGPTVEAMQTDETTCVPEIATGPVRECSAATMPASEFVAQVATEWDLEAFSNGLAEDRVFSEAIDAINGSTKGEDLMVDVVSLDSAAPQLLSAVPQQPVEATDETIAVLQQTSEAILKTRDSLLEQALNNIDAIIANVLNASLQFHNATAVTEEVPSDVNGVEKHAEMTNLVAKEQ